MDTTLFPIFLETERYVELLDDEQRSKLFMALYTYAKRGEELVTDDRLLLTDFLMMKGQDGFCSVDGCSNVRPIAWMPLPEPYKEDTDG